MSLEVRIMRSKISFFNGTVFKNNTTRFWPIWAGYLAILMLIFPISIVANVRYSYFDMSTPLEFAEDMLRTAASPVVILLSLMFGIVAAMALYSYLYSTKSAGMIGSLPVTRRSMFFTCYMTGIIWIICANLITSAFLVLAETMVGKLVLKYVALMFVIISLNGMFFFSLATFCAVITGNIIALPAIYGLFNVIFIVFEFLIKTVVSELSFGFNGNVFSLKTDILTPALWLSEARIETLDAAGEYADLPEKIASLRYEGMGYLIGCVIVGLILVAISIAVIRFRHMETATDVISIKCLLPVFRFGAAFGSSLALGEAIYYIFFRGSSLAGGSQSEVLKLGACLVLFCLVGYFAAEMLVQKSFRVFSHWRDPIIAVLVVVLFLAGLNFDLFGVEKRMPAENKIARASIGVFGEQCQLKTPEGIQGIMDLHRKIVDNKKIIMENENSYSLCNVVIDYYGEDDNNLLSRSYYVPIKTYGGPELIEDFERDAEKLLNSDEAKNSRLYTDVLKNSRFIDHMNISWHTSDNDYRNLDLNYEQIDRMYNECILPDIKDGNLGTIDLSDYYNEKEPPASIYYSFSPDGADHYRYYGVNLRVTPAAVRTMAYINELAGTEGSSIYEGVWVEG